MYARVIIDIKHKEVNQVYDYIIPADLRDVLSVGMRVYVPFANTKRMAFVVALVDESIYATREVIRVIDVEPVINEEQFIMIEHLLKTNRSLYADTIETVLPQALMFSYQKKAVKLTNEVHIDLASKFNRNNTLNVKDLSHDELLLLKREVLKKHVKIVDDHKQKTTYKLGNKVFYNENHRYARASKYEDLITYVLENQGMLISKLVNEGFSVSSIDTLIKHEVFTVEKAKIKRDIHHLFETKEISYQMNKAQKSALEAIKGTFEKEEITLLKGVTGSGKTLVYLNAAKEVIKQGKRVLVLVPEIMLIAPTLKHIQSILNEEVAIYHSQLSAGERHDQYQMIKENQAQVILGTRSACFLPIENLGLIVMDEAHDQSYIQSEGVQYYTKDILGLRMAYHHCPLVLATATPSIVDMYHAKENKYQLVELNERILDQKMPDLKVVDMRQELSSGNTSMFSNTLREAITKRLEQKEQTILLFNRKGYAPFVMCRNCGHVPTSTEDGLPLVYYKQTQMLKGRYTKYEEQFTTTCPICKTDKIKPVGVGIEQVEAHLHKVFPHAKVLRMDANTTTKKGSHEALWHTFLTEDYDILLGTQMVSKGLDFPKVTLVGVLMADLSLNVPRYDASEQTYMLLTQTIGRSGRFFEGEAIIQAYRTDHYAIKDIFKTYDDFYQDALFERKIANYEPFMKMSQILISGKSYLKTYQIAFELKKQLARFLKVVLGPQAPMVAKIKDDYRFILTIKDDYMDYLKIFDIINMLENDVNIRFYMIPEIV